MKAIREIRSRLDGGKLHALVNNAAISPKGEGGARLGSLNTDMETWEKVFRVNFMAPIMLARGLIGGTEGRERLHCERHLDRRLARASVRGRGLFNLKSGAGLADPRDGGGLRPPRRTRQCHRAGRDRHLDPVAWHREDRAASKFRCDRLGTPDEVAKIIYVLCTETSSYVNGAEIHINGGQHV